MKKWISLIMIMVVLLPMVSFATGGYDNFTVTESDLTQDGASVKFMLRYRIDNPKKGATYNVQTPFPITIDGGEYLDVAGSNGNYTLTVKEDMKHISGGFGGTKTIVNEETLPALIVDGKVIIGEKPVSPGNSNNGGSVGEREDFYKIGYRDTDGNINWEVHIKSVHAVTPDQQFFVADMVGDGHELDENSIEIQISSSVSGENLKLHNGDIVYSEDDGIVLEDAITDIKTSPSGFNFYINKFRAHDVMYIKYKTIPTEERSEYSNQIQVKGKDKLTSKVTIEDWSDIDGENPDPTEPEEPKEEFVDIKVVKVWKNSSGEEISGDEVKEITVILLQDGKESKRIKLNPANGWTYTFKDLPKHNEDGSEIKYSVRELEVVGYTSSVERNGNKFTITNIKDEPTLPELPQVGEGLFKKEYLIGLVLLALAVLISKQNKTA